MTGYNVPRLRCEMRGCKIVAVDEQYDAWFMNHDVAGSHLASYKVKEKIWCKTTINKIYLSANRPFE